MIDFFFDNIIIFLIVGSGIAQWLKSTLAAKKEGQQEPHPEHEVFDEGDFEGMEDFREFEEYQRRETEQQAPQQRQMATPPPLTSAQPAPEIFVAAPQAELERQAAIKAKLAELRRQKSEARTELEKPEKKSTIASGDIASGSLRARLRSNRELKQALVLKEILGKPVALRQA